MNIVISPILVVKPAICDINFVRMTPILSNSVNHIFHDINGIKYSVFGNASYYKENTLPNPSAEHERMINLGRVDIQANHINTQTI